MTIEEIVEEMTRRVKTKCDENKIKITLITSSFIKNELLRDGTRKDVISTWVQKLFLNKESFVISDPDTLEMLYVQTGPMNFAEIDQYFTLQEED